MDVSGFTAKHDNGHNTFTAPCMLYSSPFLGVNATPSIPQALQVNEDASSNPQKEEKIMKFVFFLIPVSPGRSRLIYTFPRNFAVWVDRVVPRWLLHLKQNLILDSDTNLLHLEEHKIVAIGSSNWQKACYAPTKADALVVGFRKWMKKYSNDQIDWGNISSTSLPPTPP